MSKSSNFFRHADKLTEDPLTGVVSGTIPTWLEGVLIRNGPGIQEIGPDKYNHLFDGLAVIHRFEIKNGEVFYQNRALESEHYKKNTEAQRIVTSEFGTRSVTDPCKSLFDRFKSTFFSGDENMAGDNCNVNVAFYGDQLYAMTETSIVRRVDPNTLETMGSGTKLDDYLTVNHATAHPHVLEDGNVLNMGNNYKHKKGPHYCIIQVPPSYESDETSFKEAKVIAEIPMRWKMYPGYYHSFGMTEDKIVFIEQPYCLSIPKIMTINLATSRTFQDCLTWYPNYKTRIHIIPRSTGKVEPLIYETDDLFTFHHINAFEEDGNIIMDVSAYDNAKFVNEVVIDGIQKPSAGPIGASARRYVLPTKIPKEAKPGEDLVTLQNCNASAQIRRGSNGKVIDCTPHKFTNWFEFPRINYKYNGKKYNFFYGAQSSAGSDNENELPAIPEPNVIAKFDIKNAKLTQWVGENILASEPIFVPNPTLENPSEDDGVVISALLHQEDPTLVSLLVLDAKDLKQLAQVKFNTKGPVTSTFHGIWAHAGNKVHTY